MTFLNGFLGGKPKVKVDTSLTGTHGSHWDCLGLDKKEIDKIISESFHPKYLAKLVMADFADLGKRAIPVAKFDFDGPLSVFIARVQTGDEKYELATGYPVLATSHAYKADVSTIHEWPIKIEAQIDATVNGAGLSFFATDYFLNKEKYLNSEVLNVELSAFVYGISKLELAQKTVVGKDGKPYDISNAKALLPLNFLDKNANWMVDDYRIWGDVESIKKVKVLSHTDYLIRLNAEPLDKLEVFASEKVVQGTIAKGNRVSANVWIQGRIAGTQWNVMGGEGKK